jgi:hypothetical protein
VKTLVNIGRDIPQGRLDGLFLYYDAGTHTCINKTRARAGGSNSKTTYPTHPTYPVDRLRLEMIWVLLQQFHGGNSHPDPSARVHSGGLPNPPRRLLVRLAVHWPARKSEPGRRSNADPFYSGARFFVGLN